MHPDLIAYTFDRKYQVYSGQVKVRPERGVDGRTLYSLPRDSTLVEPPIAHEGEAAVWLDTRGHWVIVADHRGEIWWLAGMPQVVTHLGDPAEWGMKPHSGAPAPAWAKAG